jgi:CRP/FNR family transcriptional regulator
MSGEWIDMFDGLSDLEPPVRALLEEKSVTISVPKGTVIFGPGKSPENMLLLLKGTARIQHLSESGREIVLYRVNAGESCILTTACLLAHEDYSAEGITETEVEAVAIPRLVFDELVSQSPKFRTFVFSTYSRRLTDLFHVVEEIAFQRMDIRLAQKLIELSRGGSRVKATHQQMSVELGTAREVISRLLQEFQRRGWTAQSRGAIDLLNRESLGKLAGTGS